MKYRRYILLSLVSVAFTKVGLIKLLCKVVGRI